MQCYLIRLKPRLLQLKHRKKRIIARIFFLDGKVDNIVYIILVKLVPARVGVGGFEVIPRVKFFSFSIEEELLCFMQGMEF